MNFTRAYRLWFMVVTGSTFCAGAQLTVLPDAAPQRVFGSDTQTIPVLFHNGGQEQFEANLRTRMLQASSATAARLNELPWKKLRVVPGQTIVESAELPFPNVRVETRFLIQWLEGTNRVIGTTEVLVYPTDLLKELKTLAGEDVLGVVDSQNQLKPLLKSLAVEFVDLEDTGLENFRGKLAVIGPFVTKAQMREGLATQIEKLAQKGVGVVWLQPPPGKRDKVQPSFYAVPYGSNAVVVAQAETTANLSGNPKSQLNLIHFTRLALQPEPVHLPVFTQP